MRIGSISLVTLIVSAVTASAIFFDQPTNNTTQDHPIPRGVKKLVVVNFYVPEGVIHKKESILPRPGLIHKMLSDDDDNDPTVKANKDSYLLAKTLTAKLNSNDALKAAGITAEMDDLPDSPTAGDTLVIDGAFLFVDEGGRLLQAGVGFGAGASKVEIETEILDYSKAPPVQIMKIGSHSNPRRGPGAILMMNPYVAAAKFVLNSNSSQKDIKKVAGSLAKEITKYLTGKAGNDLAEDD